jgi:hypothetical protein
MSTHGATKIIGPYSRHREIASAPAEVAIPGSWKPPPVGRVCGVGCFATCLPPTPPANRPPPVS